MKFDFESLRVLMAVLDHASLDAREGFQEVGREILVAVAAPSHPLLCGRKASRGRSWWLAATRAMWKNAS